MEGPRVKIEMVALKEVIVSHAGRFKTKRIKADTIEPGGVLFYELNVVNVGGETATNVVVNNPVPEGATYVAGSARGRFSTVSISSDGGTTFDREAPGILPETVTTIRWHVDDIPPKGKRKLEFQVVATSAQVTGLKRLWTGLYLWLVNALSR